jgi:serine/threonine protein kinase/tetratricopeptide (TPR) repeat protein
MNPSPPNVDTILAEAVEIAAPAERQAFVAQACAGDAELQRRVERLIANHFRAGSFLERPALAMNPEGTAGWQTPETAESPGTVIGPYRLLEQIGEGGMGLVYVAEQERPIKRRVALKIIKPGMDSRQVVARFEAERQALALMDHPNIAQVFDGGTTETGRPYFVMELVKGVPITDFCDQRRFTARQRLELFIAVCQAVQHAHQKGIIHRDLKPSNVLVTLHDTVAVPKVIDFGIAKATTGPLTERTFFTHFAQMIGTPLYMSPEQAEMNSLDVDTRSDVYSLGVLLYELLTGTTPFESQALKEVGLDEMRRMIREEEPPAPSQRLHTLDAQAASTVSERRGVDGRRLMQMVRGELDWIAMKALEKDRNRRYESASAFAADVQRYLDYLPVLASPASTTYRLRKALRRHRGAALAGALIVLALLGGIIGTSWGLVRADRAWHAERQRAESERQAKEDAQARETEKQAVLEFVESALVKAARPAGQEGGLGRDVSLRRALVAALPSVSQNFADQPLTEARLRRTLGLTFRYLGDEDIAAEQFEAARTLYAKHRGADHPDTLASANNLANSFAVLGRHADAIRLREETLALRRDRLGADHPETLDSMNNLASSYDTMGRYDDALHLREETLARRRATLGPDHADTLASMNNLGVSYTVVGRHAEAVKLREETLELTKGKFGPDHLRVLPCMNNLAESYQALGRCGDALALYEKTLELVKAKLPEKHPNVLLVMNNIAWLLATAEDAPFRNPPRAVELAAKAVAFAPKSADFASTLGIARYRAGDWQQARRDLEKAISLRSPDDAKNANESFFLAMAHWQLGDKTDARQWFEKGAAWMDKGKLRDDEVRRFRAEAAGVLGIKDKSQRTSP